MRGRAGRDRAVTHGADGARRYSPKCAGESPFHAQ